ncbi:phage tail spike protein [Clostridium sp. UBA1652]|uniref:phage tail spike protein n=1 Tax=Clostridium sp. UBA1652 TaxID=1946348 RepID=UPI00257EBA8B|nr:phage tail spike protein [Clostridium sp. UBA1652]
MIKIYDRFSTKNTVLYTNGLAALDNICISAEITEKVNGEYGFSATFLLDKENNKHEYIDEEAILKVPDVYGDEIFRIQTVDKNTPGRIQIYARHISYDTKNLFLEDVRPTELNGATFLNWIFTRTTTSHEFSYSSDITKTVTSYFMNKNLYEALFTLDNSFLSRLGGEAARRQYSIAINNKIGSNTGVTIRSRKNLTGFKRFTDIDTVVTRIYPKGKEGLSIPSKYVDSQYINNYPNIKSQEVTFNNIGVDEENGITEAMARQQLIEAAEAMFHEQQVDLLKAEYKITFASLEKTEEYKNFALLERIWLGDTVNIYEENFKINVSVRVIERKWNVLKQIHNTITLSNIAEKSMSNLNKIISLLNSIVDPQTGFLQQAKDNATKLIQNGIVNSYVLVRKNEILIMDKPSIEEAVKIWRWNVNGLGYSSTGYNGTFGLAMTMDGAIVADFINTGTLNANLIKAGVISSLDGSFTMNLSTGVVSFSKGLIQGLNSNWDLSTGIFSTQKTDSSGTYQLKLGNGGLTSDYYLDIMSKLRVMFGYQGSTISNSNLFYAYENGCVISANSGYIQLQTFNGDDIDLVCAGGGAVNVSGDLEVTGNKNCIQLTKEYGRVPFYSTEDINSLLTRTPINEIYETQLYDTGKYKCIVPISQFMRECINTDLDYNVWFSKLGPGDIWISNTYPGYFVIESDRPVKFKYKLEGMRRNFENMTEENYLNKLCRINKL